MTVDTSQPPTMSEEERARWVTSAFPRLSGDLLRDTIASTTVQRYPAGERMVRQGAAADRLYVITSGEVDVVRRDPGGQEQLLAILGPGAYFGEIALLTGLLRTASVQARTDVDLLAMEAEAFQQIVRGSPETARAIRQRAAERLGWTSERIYTLSRQLIEDIAQIRALYRSLHSSESEALLATCLQDALSGAVAAKRLRDNLRKTSQNLES